MAFPFCGRENGVLRPSSDRDSAQEKAYVTKVGHGYSHGSQPFCKWDHSCEYLTKSESNGSNFCSKYPSWWGNSCELPLQGYEVMNMIRKGQVRGVGKGDISGQVTFIAHLFGVAA